MVDPGAVELQSVLPASDVTVTAASLNGSDTNSPLPLAFGLIKPRECK